MKTYEKIEITRHESLQPDNLKTILLVILCSFAVGLIPIVYSIDTAQQGEVTTEPALWK